jgi:hypothetical protein
MLYGPWPMTCALCARFSARADALEQGLCKACRAAGLAAELQREQSDRTPTPTPTPSPRPAEPEAEAETPPSPRPTPTPSPRPASSSGESWRLVPPRVAPPGPFGGGRYYALGRHHFKVATVAAGSRAALAAIGGSWTAQPPAPTGYNTWQEAANAALWLHGGHEVTTLA